MERLLLVVVMAAVAVAGCLGAPGPGTPTSDSETPTPSPTQAAPTEEETVSVEYVVRSGSIADSISHVYVDFAVYFAQHPEDIYACTNGAPLLDNKYDPTPTPLPTPAGQCKRFDVPRVDVAALDGTRSLGEFTANGTYSGGHTLVVHDVTIVLENGTTASDVYDTDFRSVTERTTPSGTHGIEFTVTDYEDSDKSLRWRFGVESEQFDPTSE